MGREFTNLYETTYNNFNKLRIGNTSGQAVQTKSIVVGNSNGVGVRANKLYYGNTSNVAVMAVCTSNVLCASVCTCNGSYCSCDCNGNCSCDSNCDCSCDCNNACDDCPSYCHNGGCGMEWTGGCVDVM